VHAWLIDGVAPLAAALRPVHRQVRVAEQGLGVVAARRDPDARAHVELAFAKLERLLKRIQEPLRGAGGVARLAELLQQDRELVSAEAGDGVGRAQAFAEPLGDEDQKPIAGPVAEAVVDGLEAVEVAEEDRHRCGGALGAGERMPHSVQEERAVRQSGQRVVERLVDRLLHGPGVGQRKARVLGEGQKHLLVACVVLAARLGGGDAEATRDVTSFIHGRGHGGRV
jgi:hypothetical protein